MMSDHMKVSEGQGFPVVALPGDAMEAACALLQRGMRLTAMIQDGELQLMSESDNVTMRPVWLKKPE